MPQGYTCVASGDLGTDNDVTLRDLLTSSTEGRAFVFRAIDPLRYLALVVSHFVRVGEATISLRDAGSTLRDRSADSSMTPTAATASLRRASIR